MVSDTALPAPNLAQSDLYVNTLQALGHTVASLSLGRVGSAVLLQRSFGPLGKVTLIPGGVFWAQDSTPQERDDAIADLPALARSQGSRILLCNTSSESDEKKFLKKFFLPVLSAGFFAELDLTAPQDTRGKSLHGKWRNRLKKAENADLSVETSPFCATRHKWLIDAEIAQRKTNSYRALPLNFLAMASQLQPETVRVFVAKRRSQPVAAMVFLIHGKAATYHIGVSSENGRKFSAHNLLLWRAANWLASQGVCRLDLGSVETERNTGLARFKLGAGATPKARGATCLYTRTTRPLGWLNAQISDKAAHAVAGQTGPSFR